MTTPQEEKEKLYSGFRALGEGSVRFIATRKEIFDYFYECMQQRENDLKERIRGEIEELGTFDVDMETTYQESALIKEDVLSLPSLQVTSK